MKIKDKREKTKKGRSRGKTRISFKDRRNLSDFINGMSVQHRRSPLVRINGLL